MDNSLLFIFKTEDVQRLVETKSDYIIVRSFLESVVLADGSKAGALRVYADAVNKGKTEPLETIQGCPNPPCNNDGQ